jgi:aminopeptidase YwaD
MSFGLKKVPVLFLFSGLHMDYHRPTDTADKINYEGLDDVVKYSVKLITGLDEMPKEKYVDAADKDSMTPTVSHGGSSVTLGIVPDYSTMDDEAKGVKISGTVVGSPAEKAGLQAGDTIVQWNADKVDSLQQLSNFLGAGKPGDKVKLSVKRADKRIELEATLAERK